ncbi:MAG: hypothetical protein A3I89_03625 [Candidatus Harrisonbacteria bacterium RIFCSPLOWO2_02_FULL_41_11]|uniref:Methyltransferase domain-containing protein n=1 Tax=Candidatus Harrisonbacteria bacterium RIFCSPHIGHO2_02_FULL_42_16 TaxID=1798404 RepID=A0A1G1ZGQ7_9BACT|nr:MAG: hypothetical protein A3B92_02125 [Candidatus Harrisonbacteria bacterium RIFCSPHIGHO2_02_FULL_42_16]OGY65902.1 MAG: hypothetical protein A3I89_03625 [Candidatus Harrisonbacteria bacterium RIFCSPLOWO2_02_FULL_41_11]
MTKLEEIVLISLKLQSLNELTSLNRKEAQERLDSITPQAMELLTSKDVVSHMQNAYSLTVPEYLANPHNQYIIDELIEFMGLLPEGAFVLDLGCGPGRDTIFMSCKNNDFRLSQMKGETNGKKTADKYSIPQNALRVAGLDQSPEMITKAELAVQFLENSGKQFVYKPIFSVGDMHNFSSLNMITYKPLFSGIWSCAALFTHTPLELLDVALHSVSSSISQDGIFFVSYTNGQATGIYDKLLLSSTGIIKYFSQPNPKQITDIAERYNLYLEKEKFNDFEVNGVIKKKNLFVSQFFRKK